MRTGACMKRFPAVSIALLLFLAAVTRGGGALADSPGKLVSRGNGSYRRGEYDKAVEWYEKASVRAPESPIVAFNTGNAFFMKEDFAEARERFEDAALQSRDLSLEAKAWYNMGNCAFRQGGRQADSDMEKALEFYEEAVRFYMTALEKDPEIADAAHNLEVTRLMIKDLLDRIKKQQEEMRKQQEKMKEIVDSLLALIDREEKAINKGTGLAGDGAKQRKDWRKKLKSLGDDQTGIMNGTGEVRDRLGQMFQDQQPPQAAQAVSHIDTSLAGQDEALKDIEGQRPAAAVADQEIAREQLEKAVEALTQGQQKPQEGGEKPQQDRAQQDQEQQQQQPEQRKRDETAEAILDEEKENREKRRKQARGGYRAVEKDW